MSCRISPVVVMATWLALSGGICVKGRRVLVCCRRRWRTCCRFWALLRLDFFIVTRLLKGAIILELYVVSTSPRSPGHVWYAWHGLRSHGLRSSMGMKSYVDDTPGQDVKANPRHAQ